MEIPHIEGLKVPKLPNNVRLITQAAEVQVLNTNIQQYDPLKLGKLAKIPHLKLRSEDAGLDAQSQEDEYEEDYELVESGDVQELTVEAKPKAGKAKSGKSKKGKKKNGAAKKQSPKTGKTLKGLKPGKNAVPKVLVVESEADVEGETEVEA